jgi:hypothetical protein
MSYLKSSLVVYRRDHVLFKVTSSCLYGDDVLFKVMTSAPLKTTEGKDKPHKH